ncbi:MAG: MTH938/NDUFAF3 family protein [Desulfobacter sp.]
MITSYAFGKMKIGSRAYSSDLMIFPDGRVRDNWYRAAGHTLDMADLDALVREKPSLIIAGTGAYNRMVPSADLASSLSALRIDFHAAPTADAVALYNRLVREKTIAGFSACFHLTC